MVMQVPVGEEDQFLTEAQAMTTKDTLCDLCEGVKFQEHHNLAHWKNFRCTRVKLRRYFFKKHHVVLKKSFTYFQF